MNHSALATTALVASVAGFVAAPVVGPVIGVSLGYGVLWGARRGAPGPAVTKAVSAVTVGWAGLALPVVVVTLVDDDLADLRVGILAALAAVVAVGIAIGARLGQVAGRTTLATVTGTVAAVGAGSVLAIAGVLGSAWLFVFIVRMFWHELFGLVPGPGGW